MEHTEKLDLFITTLKRTGMDIPDIWPEAYKLAELLIAEQGFTGVELKMVAASSLEKAAYRLHIHSFVLRATREAANV